MSKIWNWTQVCLSVDLAWILRVLNVHNYYQQIFSADLQPHQPLHIIINERDMINRVQAILWNSIALTFNIFTELANTVKYGGGGSYTFSYLILKML